MGPLPLPSVLSPPPDAIMPSIASPFSGSGGATAFDERSTPEDAGVFDWVSTPYPYRKVSCKGCITYIVITCTMDNLTAFHLVVSTAGTVTRHCNGLCNILYGIQRFDYVDVVC